MQVREEVPLFCEDLSLRGWARSCLALVTGFFIFAGVAFGVWGDSALSWLSGLFLVLATGGFFALWRLSHFETNVGRFGVKTGCWQIFWSFPRYAVREVSPRRAQSWRRLYSSQELIIRLEEAHQSRLLIIPTRNTQDLLEALKQEL